LLVMGNPPSSANVSSGVCPVHCGSATDRSPCAAVNPNDKEADRYVHRSASSQIRLQFQNQLTIIPLCPSQSLHDH
jgi:hypothetical protein